MKKIIIFIITVMFILSLSILNVSANERKEAFESVIDTELIVQNGIFLEVVTNERVYTININYDLFFFEEGGENVYKADCLWDNQDDIQLIQLKLTQKDNVYLLELIFVDNNDWVRVEKIINKSNFDRFNILVDYSIEVRERIDNSNIEIMMHLRSYSNSSNTNSIMTRDLVLEDGGGMGGGGGDGDDSGSGNNNNTSSRGIIGITPPGVTSSDQHLDVYNVNGGTHITTGYLWKDDDVVKIIPKTYFFQEGDFSCIGKEYGYFIETIRLAEGYYASFVFVFDIEFKQFGFGLTIEKGMSSLKIIPKFKNWYYSYEKGTSSFIYNWDEKVATGYNSIVKPSGESIAHCLKDVHIGFMLENEHSLNINDEGYDASQDYGNYITEATYSFKGRCVLDGPNLSNESIIFALSLVPILGDIIDFIEDSNDFIQLMNELIPNGNYYEEVEIPGSSSNQYNSNQGFEMETNSQIVEYGHYIKNVLLYLDERDVGDKGPVIFLPNGNDYIQGSIKASRIVNEYKEEMRNYVIIDIILGLEKSNSSEVVEDNHLFYITDYGKFDLDPDKLFLNIPQTFNVDVAGKYAYYYFKPSTSGTYTIKTTGTSDTYMYLYDVNGNLIESDDDDGESTNASITRQLEANEVYYIKTRLYTDYRTGSYNIIVE